MAEGPGRRTPVTVITGFLGSGKTTLLSRLLTDARMANAAVIINEFGEVGLDHVLVTKPKEDVILLSSGCVCCNVRGDLVNTLASLMLERQNGEIPKFDRIVIETTGLAEPAPVLMTVVSDPDLSPLFELHRVIATVDAVHGLGQLESHTESVKQVCVADYVFFTKTDLATSDQADAVRACVGALNPGVETVDVVNGDLNSDLLFGSDLEDSLQSAAALDRWRDGRSRFPVDPGHSHERQGHPAGAHHHRSDIFTFSIDFDHPVTQQGIEMWISLLHAFKGRNLLRIKGILNVDGRPVVLQAVQHLFHAPVTLPEWPGEDRRSRLVFITRGIARHEIEPTVQAFSFTASQMMDPAAFQRFKQLATTFGPVGRM